MIKRLVLGLLAFCVAVVCAAPVDEAMAKKAISHWRTRRGTLDTRMGRDVSEVRRVSADGAEVHVVRFAGGGYAVAPTDTTVRPVILFSEDSDFEATPENPMWVLVKGELAARAASAAPARRLLSAAAPAASSLSAAERKNMGDWAELLEDVAPQYGLQDIDDVRVAPLTDNVTWWAQQGAGTGWEPFCYNYYTPSHHPCGCVATATAQVMRFFEWPAANAEIPVYTNPYCRVDGNWTELSTQGGSFDWSKMPVSPDKSATEEQRQAIGKLTSDLGILLSMNYKSDGSGSYVKRIPQVLTLLGYSNACAQTSRKSYGDFGVNDNFQQILMSNLDAKLPVVLGLYEPAGGTKVSGHAVVGDGYGYNGGTLYYHLNWGWGDYTSSNKAKTCWYSPANTDLGTEEFAYDTETNGFTEVAYNIYKTLDGAYSIASGRVLDENGAPKSGVTVTAENPATGEPVTNAVTDAKGIYALFVREGAYRLSVKTPAEDAGGGVQTRLIGSLSTNVLTNVSKGTYEVDEQGVPIHFNENYSESWITASNPMMGNVAQCDISLRSERFRTIANGETLVKGTAYDCNVEVEAGATVSLDALPADGGAAAVAAPGQTVTLKGNLTVNLPSGAETVGTAYALFSAGRVVVAPGATITVLGPDAERLVCEATVTETAIAFSITPNELATTIWTGAVDGDPQNLGNWECRNAYGARLAPRLPTADTVVTLPDGCTNSFPAGNAFLAREVVLPATIGGDLDWSGITAPFTGTLDLKGRSLTVSQLTGDATITDTFPKAVERCALLESIQSTGTQYIDTLVPAKSGLKFDFDLVNCDSGNDKAVMGLKKTTATGSGMFLPLHYWNGWGYGYESGYWDSQWESRNGTLRTKIHTELLNGAQRLVVDGKETKTSNRAGDYAADGTLYLFAINQLSNNSNPNFQMKLRLYSCRVSDANDRILRDFVPAKRLSDGAVGLYDLANAGTENAFYANKDKGGADFTAGEETGVVIGGLLTVNVPQDEALTNATVTLAGNLKLVKTGAGTFTSTKAGQTYAGGTEVRGGKFHDTVSGDIQFAAGLSATLDAPLTTAGTFTLNGDFTFNLSGWANAPGTYTLVSAGAVSVAPGAKITVTGPNATRLASTVTTTAQAISLTLTGNNTRVTAQSYVTGGKILANWDAISNQGKNTDGSLKARSTSSTSWTDVVGNRSFALNSADWTTVNKALTFNGSRYGNLSSTDTTATFSKVNGSGGTVEYAVTLNAHGQVILKGQGKIGFMNWWSSGGVRSQFNNNSAATWNVGTDGTKTIAADYSSSAVTGVYLNGSASKCGTGGSDNIGSSPKISGGTTIGARDSGNYFKGKLYGIRVYSGALTAEERAINYAIDQVRFYGATADVNTLLPAGWDVGFDGFLCRRYANGDTLVSGTTRTDYNVQFDAGATVTLDTLPETGAALTVTGKKVVLGGDVTFELPQGLKNGTYTLVKADEIGGSEGGTSVAVSGVPSGVESKVTVTETEIKVELNVPYAGEPVTARFLDGEFYYFNADGVPTTAPADGMTNTVTILFSSAAEAQALAGVTAEIAKAKAVQLDADVLLTADTDWSAFEFDMGGHTITLSGCNLKVASLLGTGAVTSCGSVIANGDFSANDVASGVVKTNFIPNGWTGTKGVLFKNSADYGYQQRTSGSLWFSIPRGGSSINQTFTVAKAGQYKLEYVASPKTYNGTNPYASWQVKLDGTVKHSVTKRGYGGMWGNVYFDNVLDLTAGTHTISFCSVGGSGETYGYGDVNFRDIDLYPVDNFVNKTCVLEVCVPAGKDTTNEGVVLAGGASLQVKKTGAGTLRMAKANGGFGAANAIAGWESVIVSAGKVVTTSTTTALGTAGARVKVESAGQLEIGGAAGVGDYEISGSGKVSVAEGATYTLDKFLATGTLEVGGTLVQRNSADVAVATLAFTATGSFSDGGTAPAKSILVSGKYAPNAATVTGSKTTNPNVRLADGATLDLSLLTDAFDATTTAFAADSTVTVDIGSREIPAGTGVKLASWSAKPDDVRFTLAAGTNPDYTLGAFPDGLYIQIAPTYATIDATNGAWLFFNAADAACSEWEGGVTPYIDVRFSTAAEAAMLATKTAEFANAKAVLLSGNVNLAENADWSAFTFDMNGHVIDLKGKTLRLKQLVGEGTITDSTRQDYELLDSIRSSGTQRIKTGVKVTAETATTAATELEIDFSNDTSDNNRAIFAMDVWASGGFLFTKQLGNFMFYGSPSLNFGAADTSKKYRVKVSGGTVSLTDLTVGTAPVSKNQGVIIGSTVKDTELILFSRNDGSYAGSYTFHRLWVKDGTGTAHTFVPVRQISTGKCGILDLEAYYADSTKGFHGNSGRGDFTAGNVTNTLCAADVQDGPGELYIEVAAGETQVNETVTLMGSLKLVKEGAGAFTAAKPGQIYSGGTEVAEGLLNLPANKMSATGCLGSAAGTVRVVEGAILDLNGNTGFKAYSVVLAGGTLQNGAVYNADANSGTVGRITLEANSSENVANNLAHTELIDLNGHTLTVPIGSGRVYSLEEDGLLTNGTVIITSGGWFRNMSRVLDMRTVDLKITAATRLFYDVKVRNLDLFYTGDYADGNGRFLVYGTYKAGDYHRNCELQDGATLDLGGQTKAWAVEPLSKFTKCTPVAFADGATIKVSFGSRKVQNGQIVAWQTGNAPADSVKFVGDSTVGGHLFRESDGLYFRAGLVIRIR